MATLSEPLSSRTMLVKYGPEAVLSDIVVIPTKIGYAPCRVLTTNYIFGAGEDPVGYEVVVEPIVDIGSWK